MVELLAGTTLVPQASLHLLHIDRTHGIRKRKQPGRARQHHDPVERLFREASSRRTCQQLRQWEDKQISLIKATIGRRAELLITIVSNTHDAKTIWRPDPHWTWTSISAEQLTSIYHVAEAHRTWYSQSRNYHTTDKSKTRYL